MEANRASTLCIETDLLCPAVAPEEASQTAWRRARSGRCVAGFGALAGSDFADQVEAVGDELDRDFRESEHELFAENDGDSSGI